MMSAAAVTGWVAAGLGVVVAAAARIELARRRELVARACHELRNPLAAASLALHGVARDAGGPGRRVAAVELELRRAALALDDLAAARDGRRRTDREELVDVTRLLASQVEAWGDVARAHGCELRLGAVPPEALVLGDGLRLAQATANLIANSVEHGRGTIELGVRNTGGLVRIEVADEGPGLPAPVSELTRRPKAGRGERGRGLAIAAEIAARHGGRIATAPSAGGARLAIELPAPGAAS
jgi:signal transduction histidine kinase